MKRYGSRIILWACLVMAGCSSGTDGQKGSAKQDTLHVSCDESFKPVMDEQVRVFESQHPDTRIIMHYKPEADCLRDFLVDSIRLVLATRSYSAGERTAIIDSLSVEPERKTIARDLIAVIVHPSSADTF